MPLYRVAGKPVVVLAALVVLRALLPDMAGIGLAFVGVPVWATWSLARTARTADADNSTAWALLAVGTGLVGGADLSWALSDLFGRDVFPSEADVLSVLATLTFIVAVVVTTIRGSTVRDLAGLVDAGALGVAASSVAWIFVIVPASRHAETSILEQTWLIAVIVLDIALLAVTARLAFSRGARTGSTRFVLLAVAVSVSVHVFDALLEVGTGIDLGPRLDAIGLAGVGLWAIAGACGRHPETAAARLPERFGAGRLALLAISAFTPLVVLTLGQFGGVDPTSTTTGVMIGASVLAAALVVVRISGLLRVVRLMTTAEDQRTFAALVEHAADAIVAVGSDGVIDYASPSTAAVLGRDPAGLLGAALEDVVIPEDASIVAVNLERAASGPQGATVRFATRLALADGAVRDYEATAARFGEDVDRAGVVVTMRDVTTQRTLERQLRVQAFHDHLTGLANRALFQDRLEHAMASRHGEDTSPVAVLFVDLDQFKQVNDGLGHAAGDELLVAVGQRIESCVRGRDTVARIGGDEFAVLLEGCVEPAEAMRTAERIHEVLNLPLRAGGLGLSIRASIGIAFSGPSSSASELVRDADIAMYRSKASASAKTSVFTASMREAATRHIALRAELEEAVEADQISVLYQPIVRLDLDQLVACEALVRWHHPERGVISPDEFVPLAEQNSLICDIGRLVLVEACRVASGWQEHGRPVGIAVNISAVHFQQSRLFEDVAHALATSALAPELLTLELTETALMLDPVATETAITRLRSLGITLAADDFGTGYCSLAYVRRFAPDKLKIDKTFVAEVTEHAPADLLVHNILKLAESIGIVCVGEGVETAYQAESLRQAGCTYGQGYYFARPLSADAITDILCSGGVLPERPLTPSLAP